MDVKNIGKVDASKICICGKAPDYDAQIAQQKAIEMINQANQKLAKIPEEMIENIQKVIKKLMSIINGWEDSSDPSFDPDKVITEIQKLLDPVVNTLCKIISSVGLPDIPGLKDIMELLSKLMSMKKSPYQKKGKLPDIPPDLKQTFVDLLAAIQSLCTTLPLVLINIIFNTIDLILKTGIPVVGMNFYTIIGMVPYIKEIPQLVQLAPKITDLVTNLAGKLQNAVEGKIKQQLKAIDDLQIPETPEDIQIQPPLVCPVHGKIVDD